MLFDSNVTKVLFCVIAATLHPKFAMSTSHVDPESDGMEWAYGSGGNYIQCSDTDFPFMVGLCGSDDDSSCKGSDGQKYATAMACANYPDRRYPDPSTGSSNPSINSIAIQGQNGWMCYSNGDQAECPYGQAIIGLCGSLGHDQCGQWCPTQSFGILCGSTPPGKLFLRNGLFFLVCFVLSFLILCFDLLRILSFE